MWAKVLLSDTMKLGSMLWRAQSLFRLRRRQVRFNARLGPQLNGTYVQGLGCQCSHLSGEKSSGSAKSGPGAGYRSLRHCIESVE